MTPSPLALDCIGRGKLTEQQMKAIIEKIKIQGLLQQEPPPFHGRGIVIAGGGKYLSWAWCVAKHCRDLGWTEGIQVWYLGKAEMPEDAKPRFEELDVELVDALEMRKSRPMRILEGWELKIYAVMNCPWRHVLFIDSDNFPAVNPAEMFNHQDILKHGSIFFSDCFNHNKKGWGFIYAGIRPPSFEWETGQFIVDKKRVWMSLRWCFWAMEHSDVWFQLGHGDKFVIQVFFTMVGEPHLVSRESKWEGWGIGQSYKGRLWFRHSMGFKRGETGPPTPEIEELFEQWAGQVQPV